MKTLLIGGARCGKSALATRLASERSKDVCCIVTATASDDEMAARVAAHRRARPAQWRVREEPIRLGAVLREVSASHRLVLIDCLTLWTANCLWPAADVWTRERASFCDALAQCAADVILVTNEVGAGIVPAAPSGRAFRDEHGRLAQDIAGLCDEVLLVVAGIALPLKSVKRAPPARRSRKRAPAAKRSPSLPRQRRGNRR